LPREKWPLRIVSACVLFNLLCELWVHGLVGFLNPVLTGSLVVLLYATYFLMLEDLVVRYRLRDKHVLIAGFVFGLWHETFTTRSVLSPGSPLGINPVILVLSTVFWWGLMQSVAALYFANRFFGGRDWGHRRLGKAGWALCMAFSLQAAQTLFRAGGSNSMGYASSLALLAVALLALVRIRKPAGALPFHGSRLLDFLVLAHLSLCVGIGLTLGSISNTTTTIGFVAWSVAFGAALILYRLFSKRPIPV